MMMDGAALANISSTISAQTERSGCSERPTTEVKMKVVPWGGGGGGGGVAGSCPVISCRRNEIIHESAGRNVEMVPEKKKINQVLLVT